MKNNTQVAVGDGNIQVSGSLENEFSRMLNILKKGNGQKRIVKFECGVCGCEFELHAEDCLMKRRSKNIYMHNCPECREYLISEKFKIK